MRPGFVAVEDERTLLIPIRRGNKLVFGLQNILANPHVGLIFMIPGTNETLRVNGPRRAHARSRPVRATGGARTAGAARRARDGRRVLLPLPEGVPARVALEARDVGRLSGLVRKIFAAQLGGDDATATQIDEALERDARENL
jgi:hypothetical protein